jgi:hypothetical protein
MAPVKGRLLLLLALLAAAGCGGGDDEGTTAATPTGQAPITVTQPEDTAQPDAVPTGEPTFTVAVSAANTTPSVGTPWQYTVTATARGGGPASGTARMRIFVGDELVDTLGFFAFDGRLTRTHTWPAVLRGKDDVVLQAEVEGDGGTQRANLPVTVR